MRWVEGYDGAPPPPPPPDTNRQQLARELRCLADLVERSELVGDARADYRLVSTIPDRYSWAPSLSFPPPVYRHEVTFTLRHPVPRTIKQVEQVFRCRCGAWPGTHTPTCPEVP